jgi:predicted RNA-binding Zn-ribbon protein involved in translation (DUF1610 family)
MKKYCVDCKKEIYYKSTRCKSCAKKGNQIARIDGRSTIKHYCIDCGKEIWYTSTRCKKCAKQGKLHSQFGMKRPDVSERMKGNNNINFIDGRTMLKYHCSECGKEITYNINSKRKCQQCYDRVGDKNPNWIDGRTNFPYPKEFIKLRNTIRKRDDYKCKNCGMTEEEHLIVIGTNLHVHHIDYNKENLKEDNLITLCGACNIRANYNREYWKDFYINLMNKILSKIIIKRKIYNGNKKSTYSR